MNRILLCCLIFCWIWAPLFANPAANGSGSQIIDKGDKVLLNLNNVDLEVVVQYLAKFSSEHFLIDPTAKGKISVMANKEISRKEAVLVLEEALEFYGFSITKMGVAKRVVPTRVARQHGIDVHIGAEGVDDIETGNLEMRFFKLDYVGVRQMNTILNSIIGRNGQIIPYPEERMLQIIDTTFGLQRIAELIQLLDVPAPMMELYIIRLENTKSPAIVNQLKAVFNNNTTLVNSPNVVEANEDRINFISDDRTNTVLVICHPKYIEQIRETVAIFDRDLGVIQQVQLYFMKYAEADELLKQLNEIFPKDNLKIIHNERLRALLIMSSSDRLNSTVLDMAARLDKKGPDESSDMHVYYLEHAQAKDIADIIVKLFEKKNKQPGREMSVVSDDSTNSLVITASKAQFGEIVSIIERLDIFRAQVLVEAIIAEVNVGDNESLGMHFFGAPFADGKAGILNNIAAPSPTGAGFNVGVLTDKWADGTMADVLANPNEKLKALFSMSAGANNVNVLSCPQLLTMDNQEANINVGEVVPLATGTFQGGTGSNATNFRFEDVGLNLTIKPRISQKKTIALDIKLEVKQRSGSISTAGIDVPIITKRSFNTSVSTRDAGTVVIGGLMDDYKSETEHRTPFFADMPVVGRFFRYKKEEKTKKNLFVFLTPYILTGDDDISDITSRVDANMKLAMSGKQGKPFSINEDGVLSVEKWDSGANVHIERITVDGMRETVHKPAAKQQMEKERDETEEGFLIDETEYASNALPEQRTLPKINKDIEKRALPKINKGQEQVGLSADEQSSEETPSLEGAPVSDSGKIKAVMPETAAVDGSGLKNDLPDLPALLEKDAQDSGRITEDDILKFLEDLSEPVEKKVNAQVSVPENENKPLVEAQKVQLPEKSAEEIDSAQEQIDFAQEPIDSAQEQMVSAQTQEETEPQVHFALTTEEKIFPPEISEEKVTEILNAEKAAKEKEKSVKASEKPVNSLARETQSGIRRLSSRISRLFGGGSSRPAPKEPKVPEKKASHYVVEVTVGDEKQVYADEKIMSLLGDLKKDVVKEPEIIRPPVKIEQPEPAALTEQTILIEPIKETVIEEEAPQEKRYDELLDKLRSSLKEAAEKAREKEVEPVAAPEQKRPRQKAPETPGKVSARPLSNAEVEDEFARMLVELEKENKVSIKNAEGFEHMIDNLENSLPRSGIPAGEPFRPTEEEFDKTLKAAKDSIGKL
jgi:general secretion pathway protein D